MAAHGFVVRFHSNSDEVAICNVCLSYIPHSTLTPFYTTQEGTLRECISLCSPSAACNTSISFNLPYSIQHKMSDITAHQQSPAARVEAEPGSADVVFFGNNFPNDDLKDLFRRLTRHSKDVRFRTLAAFLETATNTLKDEIVKLPPHARDEAPHFDNFLGLVEHGDFRGGALSAAMESATLTTLQLAMVIGYVILKPASVVLHS